MTFHRLSTVALVLLGTVTVPWVVAQTTAADPMLAPPVQQSSGGFAYLSGGAGEEERKAMDARRAQFPFKVVLSAGAGEYVVADKLSLVTPKGEALVVRDAGPVIMIKAPDGAYTMVVSYQGRTQRRPVRVASGAQTVNVRFPG